MLEKIKQWLKDESNLQALGERIFQKNTLYGFIGVATSFGVLKWTSIQADSLVEALVILWGIYMGVKNQKKAIRKAAEEL